MACPQFSAFFWGLSARTATSRRSNFTQDNQAVGKPCLLPHSANRERAERQGTPFRQWHTLLPWEALLRMWVYTFAQLISWPGAAKKRDLLPSFQAWIRELCWKETFWTEREGTRCVSVQKDQWEHKAGSKTFPCSTSLPWDQFSYNAQPHSKFRELSNSKAASHIHYSSPTQEWAILL